MSTDRMFFTRKEGGTVLSTLFVEAFGSTTGENTVNADEDLWSVFRGLTQVMGWFSNSDDEPTLWSMEDAGMEEAPSAVGSVQVGIEPTRLVPRILPAVFQCLNDALQRFGATTEIGFQVTTLRIENLSDDSCMWHLVHVMSWFNLDVREKFEAVVHFDRGLLGDHDVSTLVAYLERGNNGVFEFRLIDDVPTEARVQLDSLYTVHRRISPIQLADQGILVSMPEWSPSAAGWVLARVIDAAHTLGSNPSKYAIRISQVS